MNQITVSTWMWMDRISRETSHIFIMDVLYVCIRKKIQLFNSWQKNWCLKSSWSAIEQNRCSNYVAGGWRHLRVWELPAFLQNKDQYSPLVPKQENVNYFESCTSWMDWGAWTQTLGKPPRSFLYRSNVPRLCGWFVSLWSCFVSV